MSNMHGHFSFKNGKLAWKPLARGIKWCFNSGKPRSRANLLQASCFSSVKRVPSAFNSNCK